MRVAGVGVNGITRCESETPVAWGRCTSMSGIA